MEAFIPFPMSVLHFTGILRVFIATWIREKSDQTFLKHHDLKVTENRTGDLSLRKRNSQLAHNSQQSHDCSAKVFEEREKPEYPGENLSEQKIELTNSTYMWRRVWKSNPGHIGGRWVLSPLRNHCSLTYHCTAALNRHIKKSGSFSGSLWPRKVAVPVFFFLVSFTVRKWWNERELVPRKWPVFTAKSTRNSITLFLMFKYEVLSLEVDWKRLSQGLLELFFTYM